MDQIALDAPSQRFPKARTFNDLRRHPLFYEWCSLIYNVAPSRAAALEQRPCAMQHRR